MTQFEQARAERPMSPRRTIGRKVASRLAAIAILALWLAGVSFWLAALPALARRDGLSTSGDCGTVQYRDPVTGRMQAGHGAMCRPAIGTGRP